MAEYKVSALKYRPQRFDEVISQEFATQTLKNAIISKKTAHSYLVSGPRGTGKTTIARILAKALNCLNPDGGEPCNECENCREITNGTHPDVFELDAASNRGIDDVRAIQDAAKYYPVKSKFKFFIVDEVHMLTTQAFNAMLKILEEPPEYLIFILATTNPEKLPQTILSRCQRFNLHRLKVDEIILRLRQIVKEEKIKIDEESLFLIAKLGDGALRDALGIFDLAVSYCGTDINFKELSRFLNIPDKEIYFNITSFIHNGDSKGALIYFSKLLERGFDLGTFYSGITEHLRNLLITASTGQADLLDESDVIRTKYKEEAAKFDEQKLSRLLSVMFDSESRFKYSANQKILMETILVELCRINIEVKNLEEIISDLEELKKKSPELLNYTSAGKANIEIARDTKAESHPEKETQSPAVLTLKKYFDIEEEFINGNP